LVTGFAVDEVETHSLYQLNEFPPEAIVAPAVVTDANEQYFLISFHYVA
jgi:hypothetical protein